MSRKIDTPLAGDPKDLGRLRRMTMAEVAATELEGVPRYNYWAHATLKGDDGNFYPFYIEFAFQNAPPLKGNKGKYQFEVGRSSGALIESPGSDYFSYGHSAFAEKYAVKRSPDKVVLFSPQKLDFNSLPEEYVIFTLEEKRYHLSLKKRLGSNSVELELTFDSPDMPLWYNKGKSAVIFPNGTRIAGAEDVATADGYGIFNGKKVKLHGLGEHEHFFNKGNIVKGILKYRNECWVILHSDEVKGVLIQFNDYRDGKLIVEGKQLVPTENNTKVLKTSAQNRPIQLGIEAKTAEGMLKITYNAFAIYGYSGNEFPGQFTGTFRYNNGREIAIHNGLGWREEII